MQRPIMRVTSRVLIASMLALGTPMPYANAGMIPTGEVSQVQAQSGRDRVQAFMDREDVQKQFQAFGVDAQMAKDRVAALSDEEVARIAGKLDQAPAGGDVIGVIFAVFIILLVTDILGFTKVFPFTKSVR